MRFIPVIDSQRCLDSALAHKEEAKALFETKRFDEAIAAYQDGLAALPPREDTQDDLGGRDIGQPDEVKNKEPAGGTEQLRELTGAELAEEERLANMTPEQREAEENDQRLKEELKTLRVTLFSNIAACEMKLQRWDRAGSACDKGEYLKSVMSLGKVSDDSPSCALAMTSSPRRRCETSQVATSSRSIAGRSR